MKTNFKKLLFLWIVFSFSCSTFGEILTINEIEVKVQHQKNNEFQVLIKFDLPVLPENAHIDYAVFDMGVNVLSNSDSATLVFEILTNENTARENMKNYNANPVTAIISRREKGFTQMQLDITQLVKLWGKDGEQNDGIVLVSQRNNTKKFLKSNKLVLAPAFKAPTIRIFYTVLE